MLTVLLDFGAKAKCAKNWVLRVLVLTALLIFFTKKYHHKCQAKVSPGADAESVRTKSLLKGDVVVRAPKRRKLDSKSKPRFGSSFLTGTWSVNMA